MAVKNILIVCTGNTCRSPMAEGLLIHLPTRRGLPPDEFHVSSAGLAAVPGEPASSNAVAVMEEIGCSLSGHRARQITPEMANQADVILCMTPAHKAALSGFCDPDKITVLDVTDPFGGDRDTYRQCRDELTGKLEDIVQDL